MNAKATADAIAALFTNVTATVGTTTESLTAATASLPNTIAKGPILLVYHPTGVLEVGVSKIRADELDFPVRILRDPTDYPTRSDWLYAWYNATRDVIEADLDLGLAYVAWASPISTRIELDGQSYAKVPFDVVEFIVRVHYYEIVTTVSA